MQARRDLAFKLLKKGLSYSDVAAEVGCAKSAIAQWVSASPDGGKTAPRVRWHKSLGKAAASAHVAELEAATLATAASQSTQAVEASPVPAPWATAVRLERIRRLLRSDAVLAATNSQFGSWTTAAVLAAVPALASLEVSEEQLEVELLRAGFRRALDDTWVVP